MDPHAAMSIGSTPRSSPLPDSSSEDATSSSRARLRLTSSRTVSRSSMSRASSSVSCEKVGAPERIVARLTSGSSAGVGSTLFALSVLVVLVGSSTLVAWARPLRGRTLLGDGGGGRKGSMDRVVAAPCLVLPLGPSSARILWRGRLAGLFLGLGILSFCVVCFAMVVVEREEAIKKMLKIYIAELLHNTCYVG